MRMNLRPFHSINGTSTRELVIKAGFQRYQIRWLWQLCDPQLRRQRAGLVGCQHKQQSAGADLGVDQQALNPAVQWCAQVLPECIRRIFTTTWRCRNIAAAQEPL